MGMCSSRVYEIQENGAWTLRCIVYQVFGKTGAVLLAAIFTLGLSDDLCRPHQLDLAVLFRAVPPRLLPRLGADHHVFSFLVCNLGLNMILKYLGADPERDLSGRHCVDLARHEPQALEKEPLCIPDDRSGDGRGKHRLCARRAGVSLGFLGRAFDKLPLYGMGFGWVSVAGGMLLLSLVLEACRAAEKRGE